MYENSVINYLLEKEGAYVNHPNDAGGATCWGITEKVARDYGYAGNMADLSREEAYTILEKLYWYQPGFNRINVMSPRIALELCDTGTNMGPSAAIKWLQQWLNIYNNLEAYYPDIVIDGTVGPKTISALKSFLSKRKEEGESVMLTSLNCSQGNRYLELAQGRDANESFIYGWMKQRIYRVNDL